jgi:hypothetical protein
VIALRGRVPEKHEAERRAGRPDDEPVERPATDREPPVRDTPVGDTPVRDTPARDVREDDLRAAAIRSLRRKHAFKIHLLVYVLVNALLIAIWVAGGVTSGVWYPWWIFPLFGWGIGVAIQGWSAYGGGGMSEESIRGDAAARPLLTPGDRTRPACFRLEWETVPRGSPLPAPALEGWPSGRWRRS